MLLTLRKNRKGFTLIELIVVVAILAILAAIAVPSFIGLSDQAKKGVTVADASSIAGAINVYNAMQTSDSEKISDKTKAKDKLTATLWPVGIKDEAAALVRVTITNFVATVDTKIS